MNKRLQTFKYVFTDLLNAALSWTLFYSFRKVYIESSKLKNEAWFTSDPNFIKGILFIPLFWLLLYLLVGTYNNVFRRSRLKELGQTLAISFIGVIVIFFALLLDDFIVSYKTYYISFIALFIFHFVPTSITRFILSSIIANKVHSRQIGFNTLLIGSNQNALNLFNELESQKRSAGNRFVGFLHVDETNGHLLKNKLTHLGKFNGLKQIIAEHSVEEVIIAVESSEHESIGKIINLLEDNNVIIKIIPDMYDILSGTVKMTSIFGTPLIEVSHNIMPVWQQSLKRILDILISIFVLIFLSPFLLITALIIKFGSKGPVIYSHERIGWHGKPFNIYKFRSMYADAEKNGPALSSETDPRITSFGRYMRKTRIDELPQFYNVLIGEMSIVGPRPERQYYIDKIMEVAPHYRHLHKVRPGITSWGQVKYGYAENVEQMVARLKYDIIYIENMSLFVDLKILIYTIQIVFQGRGK